MGVKGWQGAKEGKAGCSIWESTRSFSTWTRSFAQPEALWAERALAEVRQPMGSDWGHWALYLGPVVRGHSIGIKKAEVTHVRNRGSRVGRAVHCSHP